MRQILRASLLVAVLVAITISPASAGGGCHGQQTEGEGSTVEMTGACFTPTVLHVDAGTAVDFINRDPMAHVVTGVGWGDTNQLATGDTVTHLFDDVGTFPYTCNLHPGMSGVVLVHDTTSEIEAAPIAATRGDGTNGSAHLLLGLALSAFAALVLSGLNRASRRRGLHQA